jgi:hypothetical protein
MFLWGFSFGQADSVIVPSSLEVPDAVFLSYSDFRFNKGILKEQIISPLNKELLDFVGKSLEKEMFSFYENQKATSVNSKTIWGYIQNKTLYLNYKGSFYRVPVFGSICYLVATVEVVGVGFYDPMFGPTGGGRRQEIREFLMNFYDGNVKEFNMDEAEVLISRDKTLYDEFKKLNRRNQKEQIFRYVRKYNESHPVYYLK